MVEETLAALEITPGDTIIDCTLGEGGHSRAILQGLEFKPKVLGIEIDSAALEIARKRLRQYGNRVKTVLGSYVDVLKFADAYRFCPATGVLFDLGVSSLQLETGIRGFSFSREAKLDMRFDGSQELTAHDLVNSSTENDLAKTISTLGEDPNAKRIAKAICNGRPIDTTTHLARIVSGASGFRNKSKIHPATRTFQAIRMAVNGELDNIRLGLKQAVEVLSLGGRLIVITYHSLEDRLVKNILRQESSTCVCPVGTPECICSQKARLKLLGGGVVKPKLEAIQSNPRSRSAKLRVAQRI